MQKSGDEWRLCWRFDIRSRHLQASLSFFFYCRRSTLYYLDVRCEYNTKEQMLTKVFVEIGICPRTKGPWVRVCCDVELRHLATTTSCYDYTHDVVGGRVLNGPCPVRAYELPAICFPIKIGTITTVV